MYIDAQTLERLGWLFITLFLTLPAIFIILAKSDRTAFVASYGGSLLGFSIGSLMLYYSRNDIIYAFSFLSLWAVTRAVIIISLTKEHKLLGWISLSLSEFLSLILFISLGIFYQTEIWFITATLLAFVIVLEVMTAHYFKKPMPEFDVKKYLSNFLPGVVVPFTAILYTFDIGTLSATTLHTFYSTLIEGFFALLGIVAMFGIFILERIKVDKKFRKKSKKYLSKLFIGLILLYIIGILVFTFGLIILPKSQGGITALDLSHDTLIPDEPLKARQLPDNTQLFGIILFTSSIGFLLSSLAYLYRIVSETLGREFKPSKT